MQTKKKGILERLKPKKKIKRLLIANRGEIAVRIMETAKKMGITTVVFKTSKEPKAVYLRYADEVIDFTENIYDIPEFLDVERIIEAAKEHKIDAIHPGYGYLSENSIFAKRCEEEKIIFIGPSADSIQKMGNKTIAKQIAIKTKIPLLVGSQGNVLSPDHAKEIANKIGYPVILKAASGGGGRGMRIVEREEDIEKNFRLASNESQQAFNDASLFLEKYVRNPRHIEFQIVGDQFGNYVHLGERECSIQRKHQKLIEEAPSVALDPELRDIMGRAAIKIAQAVNYYSLGTVEFLLDEDKNFYFMEMNTRIQVEHPVTEVVTGLDLVELQLKIAEEKVLPFKQSDITINGWAIEYRINAEDVQCNFAPNLGMIEKIKLPKGKYIRIDTGVDDGSQITPHFDSMIIKLIVSGETREKAIANSIKAINRIRIKGLKTTIPFCKAVLHTKAFHDGDLDTSFISKHMEQLHYQDPNEEMLAALLATFEYIDDIRMDAESLKERELNPWLLNKRVKNL